MIAYIKGLIAYKNPAYIILETGGIGYRINISLNTYAQIEKMETALILTHQIIREDSHTLFGFAEESERSLFIQLISVSGVGAATAQVLLSGMSADEVRAAIIGENETAFSRIKGIGPKTAKRIILDLKDKVIKDAGDTPLQFSAQDNTLREEALSALLALGFARINVQKALNKIQKDQPGIKNVEELVKTALRQLTQQG